MPSKHAMRAAEAFGQFILWSHQNHIKNLTQNSDFVRCVRVYMYVLVCSWVPAGLCVLSVCLCAYVEGRGQPKVSFCRHHPHFCF